MSEKPVIFISHSSPDGSLARLLKQQIELCFDNRVEAFAADIEPSENWFDKVMDKLNQAEAIVLLIAHNSVRLSHWVWFELGYFWARHDDVLLSADKKKKIYYPLYIDDIKWPSPVEDLKIQAALLSDVDQLGRFFGQLVRQFSGGNTTQINMDAIIAEAKSYAKQSQTMTVRVGQSVSKTSPNPQITYLDEDQEDYEKIKEWIFRQRDAYRTLDWSLAALAGFSGEKPKPNIFRNSLIFYKELDEELDLTRGAAKRILKGVAAEFKLIPAFEGKDTIRFEYHTE